MMRNDILNALEDREISPELLRLYSHIDEHDASENRLYRSIFKASYFRGVIEIVFCVSVVFFVCALLLSRSYLSKEVSLSLTYGSLIIVFASLIRWSSLKAASIFLHRVDELSDALVLLKRQIATMDYRALHDFADNKLKELAKKLIHLLHETSKATGFSPIIIQFPVKEMSKIVSEMETIYNIASTFHLNVDEVESYIGEAQEKFLSNKAETSLKNGEPVGDNPTVSLMKDDDSKSITPNDHGKGADDTQTP